MILEWLESLLTPAPLWVRSLGFVRGSIAVRSRFLRCREAWQPHLNQTKALILEAAARCPKQRKVVLLGGGLLHDLPLEELSRQFQTILLADVVHPLSSRWHLRRYSAVQTVFCDATGILRDLAELSKHPQNSQRPLPVSSPEAFLDDPEVDLLVSVNLLSQLSLTPSRLLGPNRPETEVQQFRRHLALAHLRYLQNAPGQAALISDTAWSRIHTQSLATQTWNLFEKIPLPPPELHHQWNWSIAPAPEREKDHDFIAHVCGYPDWKAASRTLPLVPIESSPNATPLLPS